MKHHIIGFGGAMKPRKRVVYLRPTLGQRIRAWWAEWRLRRGWY